MLSRDNARSLLKLVQPRVGDRPEKVFCGHCGRPPTEEDVGRDVSRVCSTCGMGLMLQAPADSAPNPTDPFLVVDGSLTLCALSRVAEDLLGVAETDAVNRHVGEFLVPAEAEAPPNESLAALVACAARGDGPASAVAVRPPSTFGLRYWARIGPCGPPQAALLVLADAR